MEIPPGHACPSLYAHVLSRAIMGLGICWMNGGGGQMSVHYRLQGKLTLA